MASASYACKAAQPKQTTSITALTSETHDIHFPIAAGAHAGADCNTCHGGFDTFTQFDCTTCHEHAQGTIDDAHVGVVDGYSYSPTSCYQCHPRGERADFDHTPKFPISAGTLHTGIACATCHTDRTNRKVFDCTGCHTDPETTPKHAAVTGYAWASPSCYQCHPQADVTGVDHSPYFPIDAGSVHAAAACSDCHKNPALRSEVTCAGACHLSPASSTQHSGVGGYAYNSVTCLRCHADSQVMRIAAHPNCPINRGHHRGESCLKCHPSRRTDKPFGEDFSTHTCTACHGNEGSICEP